MYGGGKTDMFAVGGSQQNSPTNNRSKRTKAPSGDDGRTTNNNSRRAARSESANAETIQSEDSGYPTATRSDPGAGGTRKKRFPSSTPGVCIDEKVLKQISDNQTKFMHERITTVETYFGDLCDGFGRYARGVAKLRDKGDAIARSVLYYASGEQLNPNTQEVLTMFGQNFAGIQDYREAEVRRIEEKVVRPLSAYGMACKQAKERMKTACTARKKELDQKKVMEQASRNPYNRSMTKAQSELQKASVGASQADNDVEQEMEKFEEKKLHDLKQVLRDFVSVEMLFHAKALELLSECYQELDQLSEDEDLEHFRNSLRPMATQNRLKAQRSMSNNGRNRGATSLMSTATSDASSIDSRPPRGQGQQTGSNRSNGRPQQQQQQQKPASGKQLATRPGSEEDDDDEDDLEDEEVDDDDEEDESDDDLDDELEDVSAMDSVSRPVANSNGRK